MIGGMDETVYTAGDPPRVCRNGHRLGPYKVIVSFTHCGCAQVKPRSVGHTTWRCRTCNDVIYADGHVDDADFFH